MAVFNGFYGSGMTPAEVYTYKVFGGVWYVVEGGTMINLTEDEINEGVNVEELNDIDCITWSGPIYSEEDLIEAVEF